MTTAQQAAPARTYDREDDKVTERALTLIDHPAMTFSVLRDAVFATPALTDFGGNREVAAQYLRLTAGEVSLAYALARYGLTAEEVELAAAGRHRYCLAWVPIPGDDRKQPCWHRLTDSGACPNAVGHA